MTGKSTMITLNNGVQMPALGLGVFQSPPEETATAVTTALQHGYRLVDTAAVYGNEKEVGEGIGIFDFALTADERAAVDALDTGLRGVPDPDSIKADSFG